MFGSALGLSHFLSWRRATKKTTISVTRGGWVYQGGTRGVLPKGGTFYSEEKTDRGETKKSFCFWLTVGVFKPGRFFP